MDAVSREIRLVARPKGFPGEDLFELAETPIPDPGEGQLLVRNAYFSVDPYMRPRMNDVRSYVAPFTLGEPMSGGAVGRVEISRNDRYAAGDWVVHGLGWREWALSDGSGMRKIDARVAREGLELFAEHTQDARANPGKHPNIDRLFELARGNASLTGKVIPRGVPPR